MSILIVTGTDTGVGKTIVTAALALRASRLGSTMVVKPTQTGMDGSEPGDAAEVTRLTDIPAQTLVELADPLAPNTAAQLHGLSLPTVSEHAAAIIEQAQTHDTVIVEGAGGFLVRMDHEGHTLADLALALPGAEVVVVTSLKLGTLNHTDLTLAALAQLGIPVRGLVIGSVPTHLDLAAEQNLLDLQRCGQPILARIPAGAGLLSREDFTARHSSWFTAANQQPDH